MFSSRKAEHVCFHVRCRPAFLLVPELFGSLCPAVHGDGAVRTAGTVAAAPCALPSEASGLRRYGHHSVLIEPNVILTTGGFGEEDGQHCRMRHFNVLIKRAGYWKSGRVKTEPSGERWGEFRADDKYKEQVLELTAKCLMER